MDNQFIADTIVVVHFGFILFVTVGGLLMLKWRWLLWIHIPALIWAASIMYGGWICPLTPLENHFRIAAGEAGYQVGFIEHYIVPVIYPEGITRGHQFLLGVLLVGFNMIIYFLLWRRYAKSRRGKQISDVIQ